LDISSIETSQATVPSQKAIRFGYKPLLFVACLVPLADLVRRAFEIGGASLGANPVEELLHALGLWALRFLMITLAVTPLKELIGKPWPLSFRRMLGLFAFFYVLLHFLLWLLIDRELYFSGSSAIPGIWKDIAKRPFITIGFTAFLMLIPMAITSTNGWIRRLGAQRWRKLHRLIYAVVLLGVWHFYWLVKSDVREPLLYLGIAVTLLGWRVWKANQRKRLISATSAVQK
jgi:sulfoxide reductase heme-binding subunit YedZ